jgi:hypothetical protein
MEETWTLPALSALSLGLLALWPRAKRRLEL